MQVNSAGLEEALREEARTQPKQALNGLPGTSQIVQTYRRDLENAVEESVIVCGQPSQRRGNLQGTAYTRLRRCRTDRRPEERSKGVQRQRRINKHNAEHTCPKPGLRRVWAGSVTVPRSRNLLRRSGFGGGVLRKAGDSANDWARGPRAGVDICTGLAMGPRLMLGA